MAAKKTAKKRKAPAKRAKRGSKGDYICHVPKGGRRKGCGAGNTVRELSAKVRHLDKRIAKQEADIAERAAADAAFKKRFEATVASGKAHHAKTRKKKG